MANPGLIIMAAISGLLKGFADSRMAAREQKLKEQEIADKRAERDADRNKMTDAMRQFMEFNKLRQTGASPQDLLAYASFAKGASPLLYNVDPSAFTYSQMAGKKWAGGMVPRGGGDGGGGGGVAVRRPRAAGGGAPAAAPSVAKKPTHKFNPATGKIESL